MRSAKVLWTLFVSVLVITVAYFLQRNLSTFPSYFFCDEAIHGVEAQSLILEGVDSRDRFWPIFFEGLGQYQLAVTVYLQIPFTYIFGMTEYAVRVRNVFFGVVMALWCLGILNGFRRSAVNYLVFFALCGSSVWFLHFRTGFEAPVATAFLFGSIFYLFKYIERPSVVRLIATSALVALCFYAYLPARFWFCFFLVASLVFFWRSGVRIKFGLLSISFLALLLLVPFFRFHATQPSQSLSRLNALLKSGGAAADQFSPAKFTSNYLRAINPYFWFTWEGTERDGPQSRHVIPQHPPIPMEFLPLWIIGAGYLLALSYRDRRALFLVILYFLIPLPCGLVGVTNLRVFPIGCLNILLVGLGMTFTYHRLSGRLYLRRIALGLLIFVNLFAVWRVIEIVWDPRSIRYRDYGFYGLQSGAREVFDRMIAALRVDSELTAVLDYASFNGNQTMVSFFVPEPLASRVYVSDFNLECSGSRIPKDGSIWIGPVDRYEVVSKRDCQTLLYDAKPLGDTPELRPFIVANMRTLR